MFDPAVASSTRYGVELVAAHGRSPEGRAAV